MQSLFWVSCCCSTMCVHQSMCGFCGAQQDRWLVISAARSNLSICLVSTGRSIAASNKDEQDDVVASCLYVPSDMAPGVVDVLLPLLT